MTPTIINADDILHDLTIRQFVSPHMPISEALDASSSKLGFCPRASAHAVHWLQIDPLRSVGRLRRTELTQLARSIHRFWTHAKAMETQNSR